VDLTLARLSAHERYKLLIGLVIPRPIAWISTRSENGVANCAPFSFFNVFSEDPPLCVIGINPRSDGALKHTLKNIRRTREFVVNLVDEATANAMHISSGEFPEDVSEFDKTGLTPAPAVTVQHPRIAEAAACLECSSCSARSCSCTHATASSTLSRSASRRSSTGRWGVSSPTGTARRASASICPENCPSPS